MNIALTNCGLRYTVNFLVNRQPPSNEGMVLMKALYADILLPSGNHQAQYDLIRRGYVQRIADNVSKDAMELLYRRNPLEHIKRIAFEITTKCNFNCQHCYNSHVGQHTIDNIDLLKDAADTFIDLGIRHFDFIGGEVSKFGTGWLDLARHISRNKDVYITLITNGWWLNRKGMFEAAGQQYYGTLAYLEHLREAGVTHILFSLDGRGAVHDQSRKHPGLYRKIMKAFDVVQKAGIEPRVSALTYLDEDLDETVTFLAEVSGRLYNCPSDTERGARAFLLAEDPMNIVNKFIDIGNGAKSGIPLYKLNSTPDALLRCKGFFRPSPWLTLKANGELATCRLANAGEGYGNIHRQPLVDILNQMQEQTIYKLHAEKRIFDYRDCVDPGIFGEAFAHPCSLRAIVTMIAQRMVERGVTPDDRDEVSRINLEVAAYTGHRQNRNLSGEAGQ